MTTGLNLTDMETCYKAFRREVLQSFDLEEDRFGIEPEITAKVARGNWRVYEVPISYHGRTYEEGKKIGWKDGVRALYAIAKYAAQALTFESGGMSAGVCRLHWTGQAPEFTIQVAGSTLRGGLGEIDNCCRASSSSSP